MSDDPVRTQNSASVYLVADGYGCNDGHKGFKQSLTPVFGNRRLEQLPITSEKTTSNYPSARLSWALATSVVISRKRRRLCGLSRQTVAEIRCLVDAANALVMGDLRIRQRGRVPSILPAALWVAMICSGVLLCGRLEHQPTRVELLDQEEVDEKTMMTP